MEAPRPSFISASTITLGDVCCAAGLMRLNATKTGSPADTMPDAFRTSSPLLFVQTPACPKQLDVELTANVTVSAVCEPVSPKIVTVDPDPKVMLPIKVTVKVLIAPATEVLCSMIETRNLGTITTFRGCVPFSTPERDKSFFVI
jgi:hypothetical protein